MHTNNKFSVVLPVYNKERYVSRSIESVLAQDYSNFELIIVCDPSTDNSVLEVGKYNDERIKVYYRSKPGPGGYAARNYGIKKSTSTWIAFLDADDEWEKDHLKHANECIKNNTNCEVIVFAYSEDGENKYTRKPFYSSENHLSRKDALKLLSCHDFIHTNSIVVKKKLIIKSGLFPDNSGYFHGGDVDTWLRIIFNMKKNMIYSNHVTSNYYKGRSDVVVNIQAMSQDHPVNSTIENIDFKKFNKLERCYLNRLYNRKLLSVISYKKINGDPIWSSLLRLKIRGLTLWLTMKLIVIVLAPRKVYRKLVSNV